MARIKDASVESRRRPADMVDARLGANTLRAARARATPACCPFHEEKTPSFSVNAADKLFYCFGCGKGGDLIAFVREKEQLDFVAGDRVARRAVPRPARVRGVLAAAGRRAQPPRERLFALLEQATSFYERYLWESACGRPRARLPREPRARRGDLPRVPARARARRPDAGAQGARERLHAGRARRRRARQPPRERLLLGPAALPARRRARARPRVPGAASCARTTRSARSTSTRPKASCSARAISSTGSTGRALRSRSRSGRSSSRATPTCSPCGKRASSRSSRRWGQR